MRAWLGDGPPFHDCGFYVQGKFLAATNIFDHIIAIYNCKVQVILTTRYQKTIVFKTIVDIHEISLIYSVGSLVIDRKGRIGLQIPEHEMLNFGAS